MPPPPQFRFVDGASAGRVARRRAVVAGVRGPGAAGADPRGASRTTSICAMAVARVEEARARAGIAKSFLYPEVNGVAGYERAERRGLRRRTRRRGRHDDQTGTSASSSRGRSISSAASAARTRRRSPLASPPSKAAAACSSRSSATSRPSYFLLRELDLQLEIAQRDAAPQRRDGQLLPESARRRRLEPARARSGSRPIARSRRRRFPISSSRSRWSRTRSRCCSAVRPGPIARDALTIGETAAAADSARAAGVAARAPARRRPGRAAAGRGQRRRRRGQGAVLPDDQPHRISRRHQRRSRDLPRRRLRRVVG